MHMIEIKSSTIAPAELFAIFGSGGTCQLLDVRTPPEYASAHVSGARLMPLNELSVETVLSQHEPGRPIYVLCHAGERARKAIEQFERAGCYDCVLVAARKPGSTPDFRSTAAPPLCFH
jgi:rhodanese-related sulfurtransferase